MLSFFYKLFIYNPKSKISFIFTLYGTWIATTGIFSILKNYVYKYVIDNNILQSFIKFSRSSKKALIEKQNVDLIFHLVKMRSLNSNFTYVIYDKPQNHEDIEGKTRANADKFCHFIKKDIETFQDFSIKYKFFTECFNQYFGDLLVLTNKDYSSGNWLEYSYVELKDILNHLITSKLCLLVNFLEKLNKESKLYYFLSIKELSSKDQILEKMSGVFFSLIFSMINENVEKENRKSITSLMLCKSVNNFETLVFKAYILQYPLDILLKNNFIYRKTRHFQAF